MPDAPGSRQDVAIAALTRRVAELEHRLNTMKVIVGLVLTGKIILVLLFVYLIFGGGPAVRSRGPALQTTAITRGWSG